MRIERIRLFQVELPLIHFFETSFRRTYHKTALLVETQGDGGSGWGECVAGKAPFYSYECVDTAWVILNHFLLPDLLGRQLESPTDLPDIFGRIRGHNMARACVEAALWDLSAKQAGVPLWRYLGGTRARIACGVSIGIQDSVEQLLEKIAGELQDGYHKIKIKIKPGWDVDVVEQVRKQFPDISLMVDANSAYEFKDLPLLQQLDQFNLLMIEQPLSHDDLWEHSQLQSRLLTPVCLDESIRHARDARHACQMGAGRIINIKMGRVGGLAEARRVHDVCLEHDVPVWCGGMLETGVGRAHNVALSTLENFKIPGDVSASKRYFERDTIRPAVEVTPDGYIIPPDAPGIGYEPDVAWIQQNSVRKEVFG